MRRLGPVSLAVLAAAMFPASGIARTPKSDVYVVQKGEWLYSIARRYHVNPLVLARYNHLAAPYKLAVAERILIPPAFSAPCQTPAPQPPAGKPVAPTVTTGPTVATPAPIGKIARKYTLALGVRDDNHYLGDVQTTLNPDGSVDIDTGEVLKLVKPILSTASYAKLEAAIGAEKTATLDDLGKGGIPSSFDQSMLQVVLHIAPEARLTQDIAVADLDRSLVGDVARPEKYSGYLNLRGSTDVVEKGGPTGFQDPLLLMDGALRMDGLILEGEAQYAPGQSGVDAFSRQGTRLVYDDDNNLVRWTLGDLQPQPDGFQGTPDMAGLSVLRLYDELAPQENVQPRGDRTFTLQRASTVQTYVNGQQVQSVRLQPGTYNASNFPFVEGANNVQLVITDDTGAVQTLNFSIFFDRTLLRPGLTEFGAFAGINSETINANTEYNDPQPMFTGFVRHGFTNTITAGGNFQGDRDAQMAGLDGLWGSPIGTLSLDLADSHDRTLGFGYAVNLSYQALFQDPSSFRSQTINAAFEVRSKNFATLSQTIASSGSTGVPVSVSGSQSGLSSLATNLYKWQATADYERSFGQYTFAELQASYADGRGSQKSLGTITGTLGYGITEDTNVNFNLGYSTSGFQKGIDLGIQLTYRMGETANLRGEYDSNPQTERATYENSQGRGDGAWSVSGSLDHEADSVDFNGSADYSANRAQLGIAQNSTYDLQGKNVTDERTSLQGAASIAFAGDTVAVGRPIFDSFALFKPHPTLGDAPVVVDPSPDGDLARSDGFGAAVLPDLGSYSVRTVTYDVPTAPAGYDIGSGALRVMPPYHSGYRVVVGSDYSTLVIGRLLDAKGQPIPLLAGTATELDVTNGKTVTLFTSRDGRFGAQGLRPGHWRIDMPASPPASYDLVIPKNSKSLLRVGDLKPTETKP
ncbi:MAG: fimbria/pilus outer membrane usher protein [Rhizomicrobium sp.]